jgi:hypothetical protein
MSAILAVVSLLYLGLLAVAELVCVLTSRPTISDRLQGWVRGNVQLAVAVAVLVGWLVAHFTGMPG